MEGKCLAVFDRPSSRFQSDVTTATIRARDKKERKGERGRRRGKRKRRGWDGMA
jgi:hypothetical protein